MCDDWLRRHIARVDNGYRILGAILRRKRKKWENGRTVLTCNLGLRAKSRSLPPHKP